MDHAIRPPSVRREAVLRIQVLSAGRFSAPYHGNKTAPLADQAGCAFRTGLQCATGWEMSIAGGRLERPDRLNAQLAPRRCLSERSNREKRVASRDSDGRAATSQYGARNRPLGALQVRSNGESTWRGHGLAERHGRTRCSSQNSHRIRSVVLRSPPSRTPGQLQEFGPSRPIEARRGASKLTYGNDDRTLSHSPALCDGSIFFRYSGRPDTGDCVENPELSLKLRYSRDLPVRHPRAAVSVSPWGLWIATVSFHGFRAVEPDLQGFILQGHRLSLCCGRSSHPTLPETHR